jgi:hypothetical protein
VVLGRHVARLEFLDVLLGDRPALTPVESFYQRMLAGDPDEAHDHAEVFLKRRSLSAYYDEVAVPGLHLAMIDDERGVLTPAHLERIKLSIQSLMEDLDDHEDTQSPPVATEAIPHSPPNAELPPTELLPAELAPAELDIAPGDPAPDTSPPGDLNLAPAWRGATPVLCIAGRGMLDEAVSTMLAQLLDKQGLPTRVVPHTSTARAALGALDVAGVAMVCISYLELSGSPSHLRYLLRRLRRRLPPDALVLVGLWPAEEAILQDERLRAAVGADYYTSSLHEAVEACLEVARNAHLDGQTQLSIPAAVH